MLVGGPLVRASQPRSSGPPMRVSQYGCLCLEIPPPGMEEDLKGAL